MTDTASIFTRLGLEVLHFEGGVYQLRKRFSESESELLLGLLFTDPKAPSGVVLYTQTVSDETLLKRMTTHWQVLDARRLGESGVPGLRVAVVGLGEGISVHYPRPDDEGVRYALQLSTGEVVCLN